MNKHIRTILIVVLTIISYISAYGESGTSELRKLLDDVNECLNEKPDSAFAVLNALEIPESEDGETMAFYASYCGGYSDYVFPCTGLFDCYRIIVFCTADFYGDCI